MNLVERYMRSQRYINEELKRIWPMWDKLGLPSIPAMTETLTFEQLIELKQTFELIRSAGIEKFMKPKIEPIKFDWEVPRDTFYVPGPITTREIPSPVWGVHGSWNKRLRGL